MAKKAERKKIEVQLDYHSTELSKKVYFDLQDKNNIVALIKRLTEISSAANAAGFFEPFLKFNVESDYDGWSYPEFRICAYRWETDKEYDKRVAANKKKRAAALKRGKLQREKTAAKELALYLKLKDKYDAKKEKADK